MFGINFDKKEDNHAKNNEAQKEIARQWIADNKKSKEEKKEKEEKPKK